MSLDWKNLFVCPGCFEVRHPQDFVTGVEDDQSVPIARSDVIQSVGSTTMKVAGVKGDLTGTRLGFCWTRAWGPRRSIGPM
jgi:hypothetical protein